MTSFIVKQLPKNNGYNVTLGHEGRHFAIPSCKFCISPAEFQVSSISRREKKRKTIWYKDPYMGSTVTQELAPIVIGKTRVLFAYCRHCEKKAKVYLAIKKETVS